MEDNHQKSGWVTQFQSLKVKHPSVIFIISTLCTVLLPLLMALLIWPQFVGQLAKQSGMRRFVWLCIYVVTCSTTTPLPTPNHCMTVGGVIWAESDGANQGSIFSFIIPV